MYKYAHTHLSVQTVTLIYTYLHLFTSDYTDPHTEAETYAEERRSEKRDRVPLVWAEKVGAVVESARGKRKAAKDKTNGRS